MTTRNEIDKITYTKNQKYSNNNEIKIITYLFSEWLAKFCTGSSILQYNTTHENKE